MFNDLSQVADIVNRKKISDRRLRNEAMRQGTSDAGAFSAENTAQIEQAQQPTEFWGAGRKEAKRQAPDVAAANFVGGVHNLGGIYHYYGDKDTSTAQFGTNGYNLTKANSGTYDIYGKGNKSLGKFYSSPGEAVKSIWDERNPVDDTEYSGIRYNRSGGESVDWGYRAENGFELDPTTIRSEPYQGYGEEASGERYYGKRIQPVNPYRNTGGGTLEDWENLGQIFAGRTPDWNASTNSHANRFYSQDNATQTISGLNTLYGSTPLLWDDKLLGYKMDLNPNDATGDWGYRGDQPQLARIDSNGKTQSASQLWREIQDPEGWSKYGRGLGDNQFFVDADKAANLPGWLNKESRAFHEQKKSSGLGGLGSIFKILGPVLSFTPLAPLGYAMSAVSGIDSLAHGNTLGGLMSLFGAFNGLSSADLAGASGVDAMPSGGFSGSDLVDFPVPSTQISDALASMNPTITSGLMGALGNMDNPIMGGLGSIAGKFAGEQAGSLTPYALVNKALGGAASGGVNSLFTKNDPIRGSLFGGMSGGLHGFLNSTDMNNNKFNAEANNRNKQSAKDMTSLAKLFVKRR